MLKTVLLASGGLGFTILKKLINKQNIKAVFTDKNSTEIIAFCEAKSIPYFVGNPRNGNASDFIQHLDTEVLLSVNYLFIIEEDLINLPSICAINFHGSLLPKYRGRTPHVWAIINGEKEVGITAHLIDSKVDNGKIVGQVRIPVEDEDTGGSILEKYKQKYPALLDQILTKIKENRLITQDQDDTKATYFGKRTPKDGRIDWNWSKERIRNWIRAQAKPYPGAFCYYKESKLSIHQAIYSDLGFMDKIKNGTLLKVEKDSLVVKTHNGCLELKDVMTANNIVFKVNDILE